MRDAGPIMNIIRRISVFLLLSVLGCAGADSGKVGREPPLIKVEKSYYSSGQLKEEIANQIRRKILVRSRVEIVDHGTLPRTQRKSQRVFDHRNGNGH